MEKIHYLKSRNSDFLAGVDLEIFELEGKSKTFKIKNVSYKEHFLVNGIKKKKGIVLTFQEDYAKPLILNPTNCRFIKDKTGIIDAKKWIGFSIDLYFNKSVRMKISKTETLKGGIRIKSVNVNGLFDPLESIKKRISKCSNRVDIISIWNKLTEEEQIKYKNDIVLKTETFNKK